jgi:hypothetical protein
MGLLRRPEMEHRWGERVKVDLPVKLMSCGAGIWEGQVMDISVSGALVCTLLHVPLLYPIQVVFASRWVRGHLQESPPYGGQVVRHTPWGFGLEWIEFSREDLLAVIHPENYRRRAADAAIVNLQPLSPEKRRLGTQSGSG